MATLDENLYEGLTVTGSAAAGYVVTWVLFARNLAASGVAAMDEAIGLLGTSYDSVTFRGQTLSTRTDRVIPWPPVDAEITLTFSRGDGDLPAESEDDGPALLSGGTTTELAETDFDADNLALAFASRESIAVVYDADSTGAPSGPGAYGQDARVPIFAPRSTFSFTRVTDTEPSSRSRTHGGTTNDDTFFGMAANTVLCTSYLFDQRLDGRYVETISFAYDPDTQWKQYARYVLDDGNYPRLLQTQVAAQNGITEVVVQGESDFDALDLTLYVYTP